MILRKVREKFCPKCGEDITDSYEPMEVSGAMCGYYYCEACEYSVEEDDGESA